jgi:hypothetical protein
MRIVVLGGRGNFGARICRALSCEPGAEVMAVGRAELDIGSRDFPSALRSLSPWLVIHCAGPFQGQDYCVAAACVAAGAHYVDLADGRAFVAKFADRMNAEARAANVLLVSGASTVPALSSAVVDALSRRVDRVEEISIAIAPGQRAPRGPATLAAVFSYVGRPFKWLSNGAWLDAWGWQELRRMRFAGLGRRWAAACDVPDLELFPIRYPHARTVEFRAALELAVQHFVFWLAAALRRAGVPLPIERWAKPLDRLASLMDVFGAQRGGMLVSVAGTLAGGSRKRIEWHLTANACDGPEIPCMAAVLLARGLIRGETTERGAYACMGFFALPDFEPEFARWGIATTIEEHDP